MSIVITLAIIAVLVLAHEWGHFFAARKIGIPVYEFSIGFGYRLWSSKRDGVLFSVRLIPLGGFVRLAGEEAGDMEDPNGYANRTPYEKMAVSFAGPFMNFVLAFFIFICSYALIGMPYSADEPVIGKVLNGSPAYLAGLQKGDRITNINGVEIGTWTILEANARNTGLASLRIEYERQGEHLKADIAPAILDSVGNTGMGVMPVTYYQRYGVTESLIIGIELTYDLTAALLSSLGTLISGKASVDDVAGPVGITRMVGDFARMGISSLLFFTAFLSINLGVMNLLPIPALDGARILFSLIEVIRRKPINKEREGFLHWVGLLLLMALMAIITFNDIVRWIKGW